MLYIQQPCQVWIKLSITHLVQASSVNTILMTFIFGLSHGAAVKLQSLKIRSIGTRGHAPRNVKLFINRPSMGFSEASELVPTQGFILKETDLAGNPPLQLK